MNSMALYSMAYLVSPEDVGELREMHSQVSGIDDVLRMGESLLPQLDFAAIPEVNKLMLAGYLTLYAGLRNTDDIRKKLASILSKMSISDRFSRRVENLFKRNYLAFSAECNDSPVSRIMRPNNDMHRLLTDAVNASMRDGDHRCRRVITGLAPQEYEHPLDKACLNVLSKTKGLDMLLRFISKNWDERFTAVEFTGSYLKLGPDQLPEIYAAYSDAAKVLEVFTLPDLYLQQEAMFNAFIIGVGKPIIVFTTRIIEELCYSEHQFIMGHELGHGKSEHSLYKWIARLITGKMFEVITDSLQLVTLGTSKAILFALQCAFANWSRAAELTADRAGLLCCQDIDVALQSLVKMAGAPGKYHDSINLDAFKRQAREFQEMDFSLVDKFAKVKAIMFSTHPWTVMRAHELLKWYENGDYHRVLERRPAAQKPSDTHITRKEYAAIMPQSREEEDENEKNSSVFCTQCGARQSAGGRFCSQCGSSLQS